jgi:hypothetical protein
LVRVSQTRGGYSISFVLDNGEITHYSASKRNGRYRIDGEVERFNTLYQLIEFHKIVPIANTGVCLKEAPWSEKGKVGQPAEPDDMDKIRPVLESLREVIGQDADEKQLKTIIRAAEYDIVKVCHVAGVWSWAFLMLTVSLVSAITVPQVFLRERRRSRRRRILDAPLSRRTRVCFAGLFPVCATGRFACLSFPLCCVHLHRHRRS